VRWLSPAFAGFRRPAHGKRRVFGADSGLRTTLQFDFPDVFFATFKVNTDNNGLVRQTVGFTATYSVSDTQHTETVEAYLVNTTTAAY